MANRDTEKGGTEWHELIAAAYARTRADAATEHKHESAYVGTEDRCSSAAARHAKWMFVFLALVFGVGFVVFGVGSDVQGGIGDLFARQRRPDGSSRSSDARESRGEEPERAPTRCASSRPRSRRTARPTRRSSPLEPLPRAPPEGRGRAAGARRPLPQPGASTRARRRQDAQVRAQLSPAADVPPPRRPRQGRALGPDPIDAGVSTEANQAVNAAYTRCSGGLPAGGGARTSSSPARARATRPSSSSSRRRPQNSATPRRRSPRTSSS